MKNIQLARLIALKLQLVRQGVGVYVGAAGVYVAEVSRTMAGAVLTRMGYEPFPSDIEDASSQKQITLISEALAKCCKDVGIKPANAYSSPPPSKVVMRYFQTPPISKKEWKEAIRFEGSRYVPFRLEETVFGFSAKESRSGDRKALEVVFSAIRIDMLRSHVRAVEGAGFKLWDAEPSFYAMLRALREDGNKPVHTKGRAVLILHFSGKGNVDLCLVKDDVFYICRDFFVSPDDQSRLDKFFAELNSSLDYFKRQTGDEILPKMFIAGDWDIASWKRNLEAYFQGTAQVEIAVFPVKEGIDIDRSSTYLIPIGLALRSLEIGTTGRDISFLETGPVAEERRAPRKWTGAIVLAILLAGVLFYFGFFVVRSNYLTRELAGTSARVAQLSREAPELVSQSAAVLEKRLSDVQTKTKIVEAFRASKSFIGEKLSILSETTPAPIWFSSLSYEETLAPGGQLSVSKRTLTLQAYIYYREIPEEELKRISEYVDSLRKMERFMTGFAELKSEGVERTSFNGRNFTRFRIICSS